MFARLTGTVPRGFAAAAAALTVGAVAGRTLHNSGEDHIPALDYGWPHHGALSAYDTAR